MIFSIKQKTYAENSIRFILKHLKQLLLIIK